MDFVRISRKLVFLFVAAFLAWTTNFWEGRGLAVPTDYPCCNTKGNTKQCDVANSSLLASIGS
ncbi:MAG: hypothetical protein HYX68_07395 [Planctomycetes bacterium]|nr:hypothetical protein [Planctomycetota bacterium]